MGTRRRSDELETDARLKAIVFFDLAQSSRLMRAHEPETVDFLQRSFDIFEDFCGEYNGELIKTTGDGALVTFDAATDAIEYAAAVHQAIRGLPSALRETPNFRAGIHVGEIMYRDGDVYGHAVNVAARIEKVAGAGEICVSGDVFALAHRTSRFSFEAIGGRRFRNIPDHIAVFLVREPGADPLEAAPAELNILTLGSLRLQRTDRSGAAIQEAGHFLPVGYLALNGEQMESVGRLCALFWPDRTPGAARRALSRMLLAFSRQYGDVVHRDGGMIGLRAERVNVDLVRIEQDLRGGTIDPILLRGGDWPDRILAGSRGTSKLYAAWLVVARSDWRNRIAQALELCLSHFELGDDGLRDAAQALLKIEPGHELAARLLIRHFHRVGNPGAAVRVYAALTEELDRHFGITPSAETQAAARGLARGAALPRVRNPATPLRIQVIEFASSDPGIRDLMESFRTEILASLACFRGWALAEGAQPGTAGTAQSDYRLAARDTPGRPDPEVSLTLTEAATGRVVWSGSQTLAINRFRAIERTVVSRIAATLEVYLSTDRLRSFRDDPAHSVVDDWLRGERAFSRWSAQAHDDAAAIFTDLIARAPDYAPAHASLASLENVSHIVRPGSPRDATALQRAYSLAEWAAELDPLDARNQLAVAWSAAMSGDFDTASIHMEMAARLNPNSPRTLVSCAMGFSFFGEHDRARRALEHSLDCAPVLLGYQWCYAASVLFLAGDLEPALKAAQRGRDQIIDNAGWQAAILAQMQRPSEAQQAFDRLCDAVRPVWAGPDPQTPAAVYDWFTRAYPLRRKEEQRLLCFADRIRLSGAAPERD